VNFAHFSPFLETAVMCSVAKREKVLFKISFYATLSTTLFHFRFFRKYFIILKKNLSSRSIFYKLKLLDFRQQFFNGSFSSQKLTNRKNSITEKRYAISDKFSTQNFSSFHFQLSIFSAQLSAKNLLIFCFSA
jgi:hypothetical protein